VGFYFAGRMKTFENYRYSNTHPSFYLNLKNNPLTVRGDITTCFHCGGGLQNWRRTDDPWTEHALWFQFWFPFDISRGQHSSANVEACKHEDGYAQLCNLKWELISIVF
jgi:hypothetical protein